MKYESFNHIFSNLLHTPYDFPCVLHFLLAFGNFSWSTDPKMGLKSLSGLTFPLKIPRMQGIRYCVYYVFQCVFM